MMKILTQKMLGAQVQPSSNSVFAVEIEDHPNGCQERLSFPAQREICFHFRGK
jgi:hypothetical protein